MIYTKLTNKAICIAFDIHKEQKDKSGLPYFHHPFHLAEQMDDEISTAAALLHDVVEDSDMTFEDLEGQGIPPAVIDALRLLTHDDGTPYMDYIQKIKDSGNPVAAAVKLADLRHNSDVSRIDVFDEKMKKRLDKYKAAMRILE
jgi:(p)ppGpp synthase/HD superfamily hydrolase